MALTGDGTDPDGVVTGFTWALVETPGRSTLTTLDLDGATSATVRLVPDSPGAYVLELVVDDGALASQPATVTVSVRGDLLVPEDYPAVADALDAVVDGYAIDIDAGAWPARLVVDRDVTLTGAGPGVTVLDGDGLGPVLVLEGDPVVTLESLSVTGGLGHTGGGIRADGGDLVLAEVWVHDNLATLGGGVYATDTRLTMVDGRVVDNIASDEGGGLFLVGGQSDLEQVLVAGNAAGGYGGGLFLETGVCFLGNAILADNTADRGAGLYLDGPDDDIPLLTLSHLTATGNAAADRGAIAYVDAGAVTVVSSILAHSVDGTAVVALEPQGDGLDTVAWDQTYSLWWDNAGGHYSTSPDPAPAHGVDGNLNLDPALTGVSLDGDWTNDDWTLGAGSSAEDAGDPTTGSDPDASPADMGAYGGPLGAW